MDRSRAQHNNPPPIIISVKLTSTQPGRTTRDSADPDCRILGNAAVRPLGYVSTLSRVPRPVAEQRARGGAAHRYRRSRESSTGWRGKRSVGQSGAPRLSALARSLSCFRWF